MRSSNPSSRRSPLGAIIGSKSPLRSRGTASVTSPYSVSTVLSDGRCGCCHCCGPPDRPSRSPGGRSPRRPAPAPEAPSSARMASVHILVVFLVVKRWKNYNGLIPLNPFSASSKVVTNTCPPLLHCDTTNTADLFEVEKMFRWLVERRTKRRAFKLGKTISQTIFLQIDKGIEDRVMPASERFMDVLRDRIAEIMEGDTPSLAALRDERVGFEENLDRFIDTMHSELQLIVVGNWDDVLDQTSVDREEFDPYIELKLAAIKNAMQRGRSRL